MGKLMLQLAAQAIHANVQGSIQVMPIRAIIDTNVFPEVRFGQRKVPRLRYSLIPNGASVKSLSAIIY